jgi:PqqD family protein of HPr-rel-A system
VTAISDAMPSPRPGIESVVVDGEAVVYDPATTALHHLNASAAAVWERCDGRRAVADVVADLVRVFHAPDDQVARDVARILERFVEQQLVERG